MSGQLPDPGAQNEPRTATVIMGLFSWAATGERWLVRWRSEPRPRPRPPIRDADAIDNLRSCSRRNLVK